MGFHVGENLWKVAQEDKLPLRTFFPFKSHPRLMSTYPLTWYVETPGQFSRVLDLVSAPHVYDDELVALYVRLQLFELDFCEFHGILRNVCICGLRMM